MKVMMTEDGSHTIYSEQFDEIYHSRHGAITESEHVFIRSGLSAIEKSEESSVFEVGFGTGLNALLTWIYAEKKSFQKDIGAKMSAVLPSPWERGEVRMY
jgi:tRNA U34 5-methylaminomethyl-2-thiouridine-forming methyltransferase MnmC